MWKTTEMLGEAPFVGGWARGVVVQNMSILFGREVVTGGIF